jgi:hypothetical protein
VRGNIAARRGLQVLGSGILNRREGARGIEQMCRQHCVIADIAERETVGAQHAPDLLCIVGHNALRLFERVRKCRAYIVVGQRTRRKCGSRAARATDADCVVADRECQPFHPRKRAQFIG